MTANDADKVRDYFSRSAVSFDSLYAEQDMSPLWRWINRTFRRDIYERFVRTMDHVEANDIRSVLDVGCGSGRYAIAFHQHGVRRVTGIDIAPDMIDLFRRHTAPFADEGTAFDAVCSDFMTYEPDEAFELVVAMGFFDYIEDPVPVLRKMARHATHSVIASFPSRSFYRTPIRRIRYAAKRCPVYFYDEAAISRFAAASGFPVHRTEKIPGAGMDYVTTFYLHPPTGADAGVDAG